MKKTLLATLVSTLALSAAVSAEPFKFTAIDSSAEAADGIVTYAQPFKLPEGFKQVVVSDETVFNIYDNGLDDWHDMNTVNESGRMAGQFMYRTHEVRLASGSNENFPDSKYPGGGAVSVVNLKNGETSVIAQEASWTALDGIRWTPWNTILFAEESTDGRLFELKLNKDMVSGEVFDRPAVGRLAHEGIDVDAAGNVYVVDEFRGEVSGFGGGVYKFVPDTYGDLSSGNLYALATSEADGTGAGSWVGPIDADNASRSGTDFGGHGYNRPEDLEIIGNTLYVAVTEGPRNGTSNEAYDGRVIAVNLDTMAVTNFVKPGENAPVEIGRPGDEVFQTGFDNPDNLAESPDGRLIIVEDNVPSDIWFATDADADGVADKMELFASLKDYSAEGTGIYFSPMNPQVLYVNVQHSQNEDGDGTWAIFKDAYQQGKNK